jgi:hypothetical protein
VEGKEFASFAGHRASLRLSVQPVFGCNFRLSENPGQKRCSNLSVVGIWDSEDEFDFDHVGMLAAHVWTLETECAQFSNRFTPRNWRELAMRLHQGGWLNLDSAQLRDRKPLSEAHNQPSFNHLG